MLNGHDDPFAGLTPHGIRTSFRQDNGGRSAPLISATPYQWRDPSKIARRPWIYGRHLMRGQAGGKFSPGGVGKTTHEVATALCLVTGRDFLGHQVWGGPQRVWLWNLEDSGEELARIIQATCKHWGITEADIGGRLFVDSALDGAMLKLATQTSHEGVKINEPLVDALVEELLARQIDYLSVDPFVSSHSVEENDNGAIDAVAKKWAQVAVLAFLRAKDHGGGSIAEQHAGGAIFPVEDSAEGFRPNHQRGLGIAAAKHRAADLRHGTRQIEPGRLFRHFL